ncbi:hypothetical protein RFI_32855 [Reticulomyxa filosa]|uniref:Uncharacterized protein n=1 Tax=Reticulomyxa filosa TaxID=46433 RepID=X6LUZ2_RETFI|nr:hypothetical protein RFI_32855 [Reticulomyxa filosa]|eukprot:ETO04545.1 hypothetical protein RFI_32855 [Reticulomyxa filosa]
MFGIFEMQKKKKKKMIDCAMVDTNECFASEFNHPTTTIVQFRQRLIETLGETANDIDIVWLKGSDNGMSMLPDQMEYVRQLIVVNRTDFAKLENDLLRRTRELNEEKGEKTSECPYYMVAYSKSSLNLSSTKIRQYCYDSDLESLRKLYSLHQLEKIAEYLIEHRLWSKEHCQLHCALFEGKEASVDNSTEEEKTVESIIGEIVTNEVSLKKKINKYI